MTRHRENKPSSKHWPAFDNAGADQGQHDHNSSPLLKIRRRDFLNVAPLAFTGVGAAIAAWPLIDSMNSSTDVLARSSTEVDLTSIEAGQRITAEWRRQPVFIARRTAEEIAKARGDDTSSGLIDPQADAARVQRAEWLIVIGICTHLGCVPLGQKAGDPRGRYGGWACPCHGSVYDVSGRVRRGPAPRNLDLPPYVFRGDSQILIG